ncbi:enhanced intracellular survival protein Eis [Paenibacillus sp. OV219]|uniref:GNAT family N-acetyltransferase n=1 Tax=Paenibacillus sp. OV219 TaxID=1884377 RepID=UPI0008CA6890|nr:GNAT family N-acetyltransferase [Paenibacillus sp. OV219]SEO73070.1 Predicted acetyltransferase [Paenibacillus sp. OV219]
MARIQRLSEEWYEKRMQLSQFAFQFQLTPEQMEGERGTFPSGEEWGIVDDQDRLLSALTLHPFDIWINGRIMQMGGIGGVASWPDARRQGGVAKLMIHALERMRENGQTISMLAPFSYPFYRKYGYEMTINRMAYTMETKHLPSRKELPGQVRIVEKSTELLRGMHDAYAAPYSGTIKRDDDWWKRKVLTKPGVAAVYYAESGEPDGYLLYHIAQRTMTIHECIHGSEVARLALWNFIANHDSMIDSLTLTAPIGDPLPFILPNPRFKQEIQTYFMTRIVDAVKFMEQYAFEPMDREDEMLLVLSDETAEWNHGAFRVVWSKDGAAHMERANATNPGVPTVECDIRTLAALLTGNQRAELLLRIGRLSGDAAAVKLLDRRIPSHTPYLMDGF